MKYTNTIWTKLGFGVIVVVAVAGTVSGAIWASDRLARSTANTDPRCASGQHASHQVTIENGMVTPLHTNGTVCDTLTITNKDDRSRLVAFGPHEDHTPYDGVAERLLAKDQSLTVTMVQTGDFRFHDHIQDEVQGTFTVAAK